MVLAFKGRLVCYSPLITAIIELISEAVISSWKVFPPHDVSKFEPLRDFVGMLLEVAGVVAVETEKIV